MMNPAIFLLVVLPIMWEFYAEPGSFPQAAPVAQSGDGAAARGGTAPRDERFISVEGASLKERQDAAIKRARGAAQAGRFWTAYQFDVRPGVAVDVDYSGDRRVNTMSFDGVTISMGSSVETRNVGVFLLHEPGGAPVERVELYNLDRRRDYRGHPVYWLGRAEGGESIELLRGLVESKQATETVERAIAAIALHDSPGVPDTLEGFVRSSQVEAVRKTALVWLGQVTDRQEFIADLVRNEKESREVRKQGAIALGISKSSKALPTLGSLYGSVSDRDVREQIIVATAIHEGDEDEAVDFLIKVASSEPDRELRKQAMFWLGQKAGERSLKVLGDAVANDGDTEVQKHAVFALSQRSESESVPKLIEVARSHPKAEVRKAAIFWLGQSNGNDERVLDLFKEILNQ